MNGARTFLMRKGYVLTALAAAALLAASPGTAEAQNTTGITITGPTGNTVAEGGTATYTVAVRGYIAVAADAMTPTDPGAFTVTLGTPAPNGTPPATEGEAADLNSNAHRLVARFDPPANSSTDNRLLYTATQQITVATLDDNDAENEHFTLSFTAAGVANVFQDMTGSDAIALADSGGTPALARYNPVELIIDDDETQGYSLALAQGAKPTEGTAFTVNLTANPPHEDGSGSMRVLLNGQAAVPQGWTLAIADADTDQPAIVDSSADHSRVEISITQAMDRNRAVDTVVVSAHMGVTGAARQVAELSVDVADLNALPAVKAEFVDEMGKKLDPQPTSVAEGESVMIKVMPVDDEGMAAAAMEKLTVTLAASDSSEADSRDYETSGMLEIVMNNKTSSGMLTLTAESDEDVGMEMLVLDATVSGEAANGAETRMVSGVVSLSIEDATAKKIWPLGTSEELHAKIDEALMAEAGEDGLNPGEHFMVMTNDLFGLAEGYTGSYGAEVQGSGIEVSTSGDSVKIMANAAGEAMVTVTGTARMASSVKIEQTVSNSASVTFPVEVTDKPLTLTLAAPGAMNGNVVEGMDYDITVTANRAVLADTEVTFMRSDMSEADVRDYSIDAVTIMSGETMATATLMVTEDMMDDAGSGMGEALHLYGMAGDTMTNTLELTIWDEAVPALPLIAQMLLALLLALGGSRLYRRRQG